MVVQDNGACNDRSTVIAYHTRYGIPKLAERLQISAMFRSVFYGHLGGKIV